MTRANKLRIALNLVEHRGPFGGGNYFANTLQDHLVKNGHEVTRNLEPGLDVVLIIGINQVSFSIAEALLYRQANPGCVLVHRINTCDEQRGVDSGINRHVMWISQGADHTVFVSQFMRDHFLQRGFSADQPNDVILTGADEAIFHPRGRAAWNAGGRLRIVTHHWSSNYLKGFDVYERLDAMLGRRPLSQNAELTVIGNLPCGVRLANSKRIETAFGSNLADELRASHLYLSAARYEPGGNHYIEAMRCGLPVLYLESGSLPEYCGPYGVSFDLANFEEKLEEARLHLPELRERVLNCPFAASETAARYEQLFTSLVAKRRENPLPPLSLIDRNILMARRLKQKMFRKVWSATL